MGHGGNAIDELMADHREVERMFSGIEEMPTSDLALRGMVDEVTIELVRHAVAEEQYLYPAVRDHVEGGAQLADKEIADHARIEKLLKRLEPMTPKDAEFPMLLQQLMDQVTEHIGDEEERLFPALREACPPAMLTDLGDKIRRAKAMAPTRPHPAVPTTPTASKLLAPGVGLVDRARDFVSGRGRKD
ncbi:hemerythrin domain-containing protein [Kitasatospora sp. NPDC052896]|uniref:hemerythrin domain-containing protein n=1 Tax=Kitasatospora sp. NPDC052896 TaxID=3364061 RepID=UPI0037C9EAC3